jgi:hypothetical protein
LHGTIPSLEEIRRFEADTETQRIDRWAAAMLEDRRFADYFAERLARGFVGTEGGQFIVYRRDRFVTWLSEQIQQHRPYDEIVQEMIQDEGLWTGTPATNFMTAAVNEGEFDENKLEGGFAAVDAHTRGLEHPFLCGHLVGNLTVNDLHTHVRPAGERLAERAERDGERVTDVPEHLAAAVGRRDVVLRLHRGVPRPHRFIALPHCLRALLVVLLGHTPRLVGDADHPRCRGLTGRVFRRGLRAQGGGVVAAGGR